METRAKQPFDGFREFVEKLLQEWKTPGIGVAVVQNGKVVLLEGYGLRDVEKGLPVTPETLFAIGSSSKAFTTMSMAILADEGKLDWDKPVRDYLPNFRLYDQFGTERITPRDLGCHRSGLPRHDLVWYNSSASREELVGRLQYMEPNKDFRTTWQYQNLMYMTAGYLAGKIADTTWEDLTRRRIIDPLGMTRTNFSAAKSCQTPNCSKPYQEKDGQIKEMEYRDIQAVGPAGSIYSCVSDMANWVLLHLNKGKHNGKQIVSEANLQQMHTPQMIILDSSPERIASNFPEIGHGSYGLGWFIETYRGHETLHHGGNIDGFSAHVAFMPKDNIGWVVLSNQDNSAVPIVVSQYIADRLLGLEPIDWNTRVHELFNKLKAQMEEAKKQAASDRKPGTQPSHPMEAYTG